MARGATEGRARRTFLIVCAPKNSASQDSCEALKPVNTGQYAIAVRQVLRNGVMFDQETEFRFPQQ